MERSRNFLLISFSYCKHISLAAAHLINRCWFFLSLIAAVTLASSSSCSYSSVIQRHFSNLFFLCYPAPSLCVCFGGLDVGALSLQLHFPVAMLALQCRCVEVGGVIPPCSVCTTDSKDESPIWSQSWKTAGKLYGRCCLKKVLLMLREDTLFIPYKKWQSIFLLIILSILVYLLLFSSYPHHCLFFLPWDWQNLRGNK